MAVDLDKVEKQLNQAESFVDAVEDITGLSLGLSGLRRDYVDLSALQASQLATTVLAGTETVLSTPEVDARNRVAYRFSRLVDTADDTASRVAEVESFVRMDRLWSDAVATLNTTNDTLGRTVYPQGVKRRTIGVVRMVDDGADWDEDTELFRVRGRLDLGDVPVALVRETLLGAALVND